MPELPEVETIRRGLGKFILNKKIERVGVDFARAFIGKVEEVEGAKVVGLRRRGKALLVDLDNEKTVMIHLRMTGQLIYREDVLSEDLLSGRMDTLGVVGVAGKAPEGERTATYNELMEHQFAAGHPSKNFMENLPNTQTRVIFEFAGGRLFFNDQRKFGFMKVLETEAVEQEKFIAELGKEPWEMTGAELYEKCQRHKSALIKAVLLDQKVIAGLGNIYADESLFYAGVHPMRRAGSLSEEEVQKVLEGACKVMTASIESGGSTMATYVRPDGTTGDYLEKFAQVFRKEGTPCPRCGETIVKIRVAGRGTHVCPACQTHGEGV